MTLDAKEFLTFWGEDIKYRYSEAKIEDYSHLITLASSAKIGNF